MLSFDQIRDLLYRELGKGKWIVELYEAYVIYEDEGLGKLFRADYSIDDNQEVALGQPTEVDRQVEYVKVNAALRAVAAAEGDPESGRKWKVMVVEFGPDVNGNWWDQQVLSSPESLALFEGAKVFCLSEAQHQAQRHPFGKSVRDLVGWLENVQATKTGIEATLLLAKSAAWLDEMVLDAWNSGKKDLVGLSVDISGKAGKKTHNGKQLPMLATIAEVTVDVVYDPAAGGKFLQLAAAKRSGEMEKDMLKQLLAALKNKRPDLYEKISAQVDDGSITEDVALEQVVAAMQSPIPEMGAEFKAAIAEIVAGEVAKLQAAGQSGGEGSDGKALEQVNLLACGIVLRDELGSSKLPEVVQAKLKKRFEEKVFKTEDLRAAITEEKETLDQLAGSGLIEGAGQIRFGADQAEKADQYLDDFFEGKVNSFKACYQDITGDQNFTGQTRNATRLTASLTSGSFAEVLGDSITRKLIADYKLSNLSDWRKIVNVVPVSDFRTQHRTRFGGYGDLPAVAESGAYNALASPTDEEATYAPSKRGGTEDVTLEMIRNDDAGAIRRIPSKLSRAAARTLYKFVMAFLDTNPAIYDAVALFNAGHNNLLTAALAKAALQAARLQMLQQMDYGDNDYLGIPPKYMVIPSDLEDTAYELTVQPNLGQFQPAQADTIRRQTWELIVNPFWTDANNWFLVADPLDVPTIEIAFLDGREEPDLFVQDMPNVGSMFSNDKLTYKIRHIYGGCVEDFRGMQGNLVI